MKVRFWRSGFILAGSLISICLLIVCLTAVPALATPIWGSSAMNELTGSRSTALATAQDPYGGLYAAPDTGTWYDGGFTISWNVVPFTVNQLQLYEYNYTIDDPEPEGQGALSGWLLEFTESESINFYDEYGTLLGGNPSGIVEGPKSWTAYGDFPIPNSNTLWGVKLGNSTSVTFITDLDPVYGVAVWKDGSVGGTAWTGALELTSDDGYKTDYLTLTENDFIVRPDGGSPVPEPATLLLLGTGLVGLAGFSRRKFKK